jgi:tetratricopeptide (TPR) repeat protein
MERIEKYILGELNAEEEQEVKNKIDSDPEWKKEFEFLSAVKQGIARKELKAYLQRLDEKPKRNYWWVGAAAAIILLSIIFFPKREFSDQAYFRPLPNLIQPSVRDVKYPVSTAFSAYEAGNFEEALKEFEKLEPTPEVLLYKGVCYLVLEKNEEAVTVLKQVNAEDADIAAYAKWYLALSFQRTHQTEEAKSLFKELIQYENPVQEMAKKVLEELP